MRQPNSCNISHSGANESCIHGEKTEEHNPVLPHTPSEHVAPFGQAEPHAPQFVRLRRLVSHPFAVLPSQSAKPSLQERPASVVQTRNMRLQGVPHTPYEHVASPFASV